MLQAQLFDTGDGTPILSRSRGEMIRRHGLDAQGRKCGECVHCIRQEHHGKAYYKCNLTIVTRGAGSDWRKKWAACGAFTARDVRVTSAGSGRKE